MNFPEVDPTLFMPDQSLELSLALATAAEDYVSGKEVVETYLKQNDPAVLEALTKEVQELPENGLVSHISP